MRWALGLMLAASVFAQTPQNFYWIGGSVTGASNLTTTGAIPYVSAASTLNQDASNLFWDSTNHRLGIGTTSPSVPLQVNMTADGNQFSLITAADGGNGVFMGLNTTSKFAYLRLNTPSTYGYSFEGPSGSTTFLRMAGTTRNVLVGGATDGNYRLDVQSSGSTGTLRVYDQTATTGFTRVLFDLGAADTSSTEIFRINGVMRFGGSSSTGAGSAALGANSPAVTLTAPYTWAKVITSDGSTGYIPIWK